MSVSYIYSRKTTPETWERKTLTAFYCNINTLTAKTFIFMDSFTSVKFESSPLRAFSMHLTHYVVLCLRACAGYKLPTIPLSTAAPLDLLFSQRCLHHPPPPLPLTVQKHPPPPPQIRAGSLQRCGERPASAPAFFIRSPLLDFIYS